MSLRPVVIAASAAAAIGVAGFAALRDGHAPAADPPREPPAVLEGGAVLRAPEFPPVRGDADRIVHWVLTLQTGSDDDVAWAVRCLRTAGAEGRRAVRDAATVAIESNPALVEQALDFLTIGAGDADVPFAVASLACRDPQAVMRAMRLVAAHPGPGRDAVARAVAAAAAQASREVRLEALSALARIGGDAAADGALRLIDASPSSDAPGSWAAITGFAHAKVHAALVATLGTETNLAARFAVADVLASAGDRAPEAWLESLLRAPPPGSLDYADAAVGALAKLRNPEALARLGATLADPLAGSDARVTAIRRLASYPMEARRAWLEAVADSATAGGDDVRIEAIESLVRGGAPGALLRVDALARSGNDAEATVAAMACGRLRRPETAGALAEALRRTGLTEDTRAFVLRALVLAGDVASAEAVARFVAADRGPVDARVSLAHNAGAMLSQAAGDYWNALSREFLRGLAGDFGPLAGSGLVETIRAVGLLCGPEAAAPLAARLTDSDPLVRSNAALALGYAAGPASETDLRAAWWRADGAEARAHLAKAMERAHYRALPPVR